MTLAVELNGTFSSVLEVLIPLPKSRVYRRSSKLASFPFLVCGLEVSSVHSVVWRWFNKLKALIEFVSQGVSS